MKNTFIILLLLLLATGLIVGGIIMFRNNSKSPPVKTKTYTACSNAACASKNDDGTYNDCEYKTSGCPTKMARPWVMCKDDTGDYFCAGEGSLNFANAVIKQGGKYYPTSGKKCSDICPAKIADNPHTQMNMLLIPDDATISSTDDNVKTICTDLGPSCS